MTIATLGIKIDSSQAVTAATALERLADTARPATVATTALEKASSRAAAANKSLRDSTRQARAETVNMSRQIQDVGVSLVSGQSPFMVLIQQGAQIGDILANSNRTTKQFFGDMLRGVASVITPMRLLGAGTVALGIGAIAALSSWKGFALQLDDTARAAGITTQEMGKLQSVASFKGINGDEFSKGIANFSRDVYLAKNNMGGLADVLRANAVPAAKNFDDAMGKAANIIKNATDDQQRLVLLQQMGLPATMEWVRLMSQGADGLKRAKQEETEFSAANDEIIAKARAFDEAWNRGLRNISTGFRNATISAASFFNDLDNRGKRALMALGVNVGVNTLRNAFEDRKAGIESGTTLTHSSSTDEFYRGLGSDAPGNKKKPSVDPATVRNNLALEQQRIGLLGQTASVLDQVRGVEIQVAQARANGVSITNAQVETLKRLAAENALGITQIKGATDAWKIEAATVGMSTGEAVRYAAVQNAINEARRAGRTLTAENIAAIRQEAAALGGAAAQADLLRFGYENLVRGPMQTFRSELQNGATWFDALKKAGVSALDAISSKLMDMAAQNLWKSAFGGGGSSGGGFLSGIIGMFGGGGTAAPTAGLSGLAAIHHTGHGPGDPISKRYVHPAYFDNAPRFHSGIGPGERAAVIRNDESVLTPGQMKALAPAGSTGGGVSIQGGDVHITVQGNADEKAMAMIRQELAKRDAAFMSNVRDSVVKLRSGRHI